MGCVCVVVIFLNSSRPIGHLSSEQAPTRRRPECGFPATYLGHKVLSNGHFCLCGITAATDLQGGAHSAMVTSDDLVQHGNCRWPGRPDLQVGDRRLDPGRVRRSADLPHARTRRPAW